MSIDFLKGLKPYIIAEAGVNHNGDLDTAYRLVDAAAEAGANAVKFQTFRAEAVAIVKAEKAAYQKRSTSAEETQLAMLKKLELKPEHHPLLAAYARKKGIEFLSTGFDSQSVDLLEGLGVPFFKIPSGEMTNDLLLKHIAMKNKPMVLSTGMANLEEIRYAVEFLRGFTAAPIVVLHCITAYPVPLEQANLLAIRTLAGEFNLPAGYSDHTLGIDAAVAATALGAVLIEKHLTLSRQMPGPDHQASLEPHDFKLMVQKCRAISNALGSGVKKTAACEIENIAIARRSFTVVRDMKPGEILTAEVLTLKRPGTGIPAQDFKKLIGKKLTRTVSADELLNWEHFQ